MAMSTASSPAGNVEPRSSHVADSSLRPFLQPDFDPVDYLNSTLPPLSLSSTAQRAGRAVALPELSSQLQTLLAQWNAQTARLSNTLTQLTDEIIRSGSRLAYEVEVLRGETFSLTDTFQTGLKKDIELFVPGKPAEEEHIAPPESEEQEADGKEAATNATEIKDKSVEPEFLEKLRQLTTVRERLDAVVKTFGSAMQWPLAPSETSLTSSLISVSGPESSDDTRTREEKGKEYAEKLRTEINDLLAIGTEGLDAANARVDEMRGFAEVFKGTAEEKARIRFVESLQKTVDDKRKALGRTSVTNSKSGPAPARGYDLRYGQPPSEGGTGYGFLQNLRNLKNEVYMD
ncbi:hypothetical protein CERZMDRAFT_82055 [Cercospora zeae-maydis SCOH1-5]|uniref:Uncharacterized protein n=1 Tax=Cercospora zeae-maydis SCOH1-5 TaxID=717836 RepID=A0A6A6FR75_9PEZI|nr:hypothetical protein CERZMDRAFT_82055 [Cercospora zeae-maydis SCOH1-5]